MRGPGIKFKTDRLRQEWPCVAQPLRAAIMDLADCAFCLLGKADLTITCLHRTSTENTEVGGHPRSKHMRNPTAAVDLRRWGWKPREIQAIRDYWDTHYGDGWDFVVEGNHFHVEMP